MLHSCTQPLDGRISLIHIRFFWLGQLLAAVGSKVPVQLLKCNEIVQALFAAGETNNGRAAATAAMRLCPAAALNTSADAAALADWLSSAWDYLAMGNYPYESTYILNGGGVLPA